MLPPEYQLAYGGCRLRLRHKIEPAQKKVVIASGERSSSTVISAAQNDQMTAKHGLELQTIETREFALSPALVARLKKNKMLFIDFAEKGRALINAGGSRWRLPGRCGQCLSKVRKYAM